MRKTFIITIIFLILLLSLALTNPNKQDFYKYVRKDIKKNQKDQENKLKKIIDVAEVEAQILGIKIMTKRKNYGFFSIFRASGSENQNSFRVLGFWKFMFIPIK